MQTTRRGFIAGCSAAIAALSGSRFNTLAFAAEPNASDDVLVHVFLRGGMDGLNLVPPIDGPDRGLYEGLRPRLRVPTSGTGAALSLDGQFGLHPSAAPLLELYQDGRLAIVHAAGMTEANRSHFDAMQFIELGTPGSKSVTTGWLTRHLESACLPDEIIMPSLAVGNLQPVSLLGSNETVNLDDPQSFALNTGPYHWRPAQRTALRRLYQNSSWLHEAGLQALNALDIIELNASGDYVPENGAVYPSGTFGDHLQTVAQMIKLDLGLRVATLDLGGWDTHEGQGNGSGGYFSSLVGELAQGLHAFYTDLDGSGASPRTGRLTCVVQSEFGRRCAENANAGTDHGHGNALLVLSGNAVGGLHGTWPGLAQGQLFEGDDLAVTTDYRQVLAEILVKRFGQTELETIFPGFTDYQPLGLITGAGAPPPNGDAIFSDDFEAGGWDAWTSATGT